MKGLDTSPGAESRPLAPAGGPAPLVGRGFPHPPLHVSFVMGVTGGIPPSARNLATMADNAPAGSHWGVIGISRQQWMLVAAALTLGGSVRGGLEDNFYLPNGEMGGDRQSVV